GARAVRNAHVLADAARCAVSEPGAGIHGADVLVVAVGVGEAAGRVWYARVVRVADGAGADGLAVGVRFAAPRDRVVDAAARRIAEVLGTWVAVVGHDARRVVLADAADAMIGAVAEPVVAGERIVRNALAEPSDAPVARAGITVAALGVEGAGLRHAGRIRAVRVADLSLRAGVGGSTRNRRADAVLTSLQAVAAVVVGAGDPGEVGAHALRSRDRGRIAILGAGISVVAIGRRALPAGGQGRLEGHADLPAVARVAVVAADNA